MKFLRCYTIVCCALAGWALSESATAMSLGRLRGASVLGQPLALTIPLQSTGDEDVSGLCVVADVFFGDAMVEASQVTARLEGGSGATFIRVSVRKPVDEPIVTLYLKTGCQQQSTRKYVLLSEFSSEVQPPLVASEPGLGAGGVRSGVPQGAPGAGGVSASAVAATGGKRPAKSRPVAETPGPTMPAPAVRKSLPEPEKRASAPPNPGVAKKKAATGAARLQLLPLELTQDWEPSLRLTDQLALPTGDVNLQKRAQAAELWRAISASPEEILQEAGKRAAMQAELRDLVAVSRTNQAAITRLNAQLQAAHEARVMNPGVYVLLVLLAACGAVLGYVWSGRSAKNGGQAPWWQGANGGADSAMAQWQGAAGANQRVTEPEVAESVAASAGSGATAIDIPLSDSVLPGQSGEEHLSSHAARNAAQPSEQTKPTDFTHSNLGALRAINTQEMVDARQQADFFVALGQHDEAVGVLYAALSQSAESNPHIYLDLIALLHKLSRKDDYEKVRQVFNALYTCHLPAYGDYSNSGRSLLEYPDLLAPLVSLWPQSVAVEYVVSCLVRDDADSAESGIDRDAFEDLLLLHGVLGSVAVAPAPSDALRPCPARTLPTLAAQPQPFLAPKHSLAAGVDLDLSAGR